MTEAATTEGPTKVWICPLCGKRYDAPTVCSNEHPPTDCEQYDLDESDTAEASEPDEAAAAAAEAAAAAATTEPAAASAEPAATPAAPVETGLQAALAAFDAAYADLKTKLGL